MVRCQLSRGAAWVWRISIGDKASAPGRWSKLFAETSVLPLLLRRSSGPAVQSPARLRLSATWDRGPPPSSTTWDRSPPPSSATWDRSPPPKLAWQRSQ
eukprot:2417528-Lingulodinium_polyedra.AAC.1